MNYSCQSIQAGIPSQEMVLRNVEGNTKEIISLVPVLAVLAACRGRETYTRKGITKRLLQNWLKHANLEPSHLGHHLEFSTQNLFTFYVLHDMSVFKLLPKLLPA